MNRTSGLLSASKSSIAVSEGGGWEEEKPQDIGRHGYRKASVAAVSSQLLAADEHFSRNSCQEVDNRQCALSSVAAPCTAESTPVSSTQQLVGMSAGARPKQRPQPETRETVSQASLAFSPSDTRKAGRVKRTRTRCSVPVLPQQLSEKGYRLKNNARLLGKGSIQSVYSLARELANGSEISGFAIKFPCKDGRGRALKGLEIQEELASMKGGDQYFVPVVEKVVENGELICHVEPEGRPVAECIDVDAWGIEQQMSVLCRTLGAINMMHAKKIAHLDIKPDNLIVKNPTTEMMARLCDFEFAMKLNDMDQLTIIRSGTCENLSWHVLRGERYYPVLADLWAFTFTAWMLMALDKAPLHWLSGMLSSEDEERRNKIATRLTERLVGAVPLGDKKYPPGSRIQLSCDKLIALLRKTHGEKDCRSLQQFFWDYFEFPADIDQLRFTLAAEKYILKEMLSIMFSPFSYSNKVNRMMDLIAAASHCAKTLDAHPEYDEKEVQQQIQSASYKPVVRLAGIQSAPPHPDWSGSRQMPEASAKPGNEQHRQLDDFMARKQSVFQFMEQLVERNDVRDMLIGYLAEGGPLNFLEEEGKDDNQLFLWLMGEWRARRGRQKESSPLKLAC